MHILKKLPRIHGALLALAVIFTSCAAMDDYLEIAIDQTVPTVIFEGDLSEENNDTLVLISMQDASIMKGVSYHPLTFYLKNTNGDFEIIDSKNTHARFLHFTEVTGDNLTHLSRDLPGIEGRKIFALYLKGMTVDENQLRTYETLADGDFRGISFRSGQLIKDRKVDFIVRDSDVTKAVHKKFVSEVYKPAF